MQRKEILEPFKPARPWCLVAARSLVLWAHVALIWGGSPAVALDSLARVQLRDGDRISGELLSLIDGSLKLATGYAGNVTIDVAAVTGLESPAPVILELTDGAVHEGRLLEAPPGELRLATESGAEEVFELADVAAINRPRPPAVTYSGSVSLGANVQRGNSEQTTLSAAAEAVRQTKRHQLSFRFRWIDSQERERQTAESAFAAFQFDRFLSDRLYGFAGTELLNDEFKDLDLRTAINLGVGYELIAGDRLEVALEGGLTYLERDFIVAEDVDELTARFAADLAWSIGPLKLSEHLLVYPSFEEGGFELRSETGVSTELFKSWALELAAVFEYDSEPAAGLEKGDLIWVLGLQYGF